MSKKEIKVETLVQTEKISSSVGVDKRRLQELHNLFDGSQH